MIAEFISSNLPAIRAAAVFAILLLIAVLLLTKKQFKLKMGDKEMSVGSPEDDAKDPPLDSKKCQECKQKVFDATRKRVKTIARLREELLRTQMRYATNKFDFMTRTICDEYIVLLAKYITSSDLKMEKSYLLFKSKFLDFRFNIMEPRIESILLENHILEKTTDQWKEHKNQILEGVSADVGKFLEVHYSCEDVPREDLESFIKDKWPFISGKVVEILDNARYQAQDSDVLIKEVKNRTALDIFGTCPAKESC
jgi:hypothetical protein